MSCDELPYILEGLEKIFFKQKGHLEGSAWFNGGVIGFKE
jgi:hypothetical protein